MKLIHVRVLLDIRAEEWFEFQAYRGEKNTIQYSPMASACVDLLDSGMVEYVNGKLRLTQKARDFLDGLEEAMRKYSD